MNNNEVIYLDDVLCDLNEGCWDKQCEKLKCVWNINKKDAKNCFLLYKYMINDNQHTLYEIADTMRISHATIKLIESETSQKLKETSLINQID